MRKAWWVNVSLTLRNVNNNIFVQAIFLLILQHKVEYCTVDDSTGLQTCVSYRLFLCLLDVLNVLYCYQSVPCALVTIYLSFLPQNISGQHLRRNKMKKSTAWYEISKQHTVIFPLIQPSERMILQTSVMRGYG